MIESLDIISVLSGGETNTKSENSLGGTPSAFPVSSKLFGNISSLDAIDGTTHYKCIYLINDNQTDALGDAKIYVEKNQVGSDVYLGFRFENCVQQVTITNTPSFEFSDDFSSDFSSLYNQSLDFDYDGTEFNVEYDENLAVWANNFQTAINEVEGLEEVTVTGSEAGTAVVFEISFTGTAGNRFHPTLTLVDSNDLPEESDVIINKIIDGGPINSIAVETDNIRTVPFGVTFVDATNPIEIGNLLALDMVPVWIKRTCSPNTMFMADDGFTLKLDGNPYGVS